MDNGRMSLDVATNPFQRGAGSFPPVLAGRQAELAALGRIVDGLRDGSLKQTIHLMQAPRGLGKTVLLQALESAAGDQPESVDIVRLSAGSFPALNALAALVTPAAPIWRRVPRWLASLSMFGVRQGTSEQARPWACSGRKPKARFRLAPQIQWLTPSNLAAHPCAALGKLLIRASPERPSTESAFDSLELALARRSQRPLLLAIDEAHVMPPDICRMLLNTFQNLAGKARCALLLIGTPVLKPFLLSGEVNASFAERAPVLVPGLLSPSDSLLALRVPQWSAWTVDDAVLEEVVVDSLGYPFFLQLWGEQLWEAGVEAKTVDRAVLATARRGVDAVRDDFYAARFDEFESFANKHGMDRDALLAAVQKIAPHVSSLEAAISTGPLNRLLQEADLTSDEATFAKRCMIDNGFLTRTGDDWRAAIPSLATYICTHPR